MKKLYFFLPLLFIGCTSPAQNLEQVSAEQIDQQMKTKAIELGNQTLSNWNQSKFKDFDESNATTLFRQQFTQDVQKKAWQQISGMFGDFKEIQLEQIWQVPNQNLIIFRFRSEFTKGNPEVRIVMNQENKLSGLFIKPWQDQLN